MAIGCRFGGHQLGRLEDADVDVEAKRRPVPLE